MHSSAAHKEDTALKHKISRLLLLVLLSLLALVATSCGNDEVITLNVYNWGEYISDGSEGTLDVNKEFEAYYYETYGVKVKVNYTTYASNEDMYAKLKSGATNYDVIIPSDYMIARMIEEDMLAELNFDNIPNYAYILDEYRNLYYDPENRYSIPYTYGMIGIIYNINMVDEADIGSWDLLWNDKYSGKILQFNNSRDAFGTAMYRLGIDVNTNDPAQWRLATDALKEQKPLVQSYVMDEIFNKMKGESGAIASYYAGDYLSMYDSNSNLAFYYPEEGTNVFVDAMCIPVGSTHRDVAERYINFMLSEEVAIANAEYICYASPNRLVIENEDYIACMEELHEDAMEILYPSQTVDTSYYHNLPAETLSMVNGLWEELKIESSGGEGVYICSAVIAAVLVVWFTFLFVRKKYRDHY